MTDRRSITSSPRFALSLLLLTTVWSVVGCEQPLETGYVPRRLNGSESDRRSYYAPAYTPEAKPEKRVDNAPDVMSPRR